ncbi:MAG: hypothetical protein JZU49_06215 [Sulfuricurvum sp.]|nr:hypothetical protein [Sulfuricurvum sp.]
MALLLNRKYGSRIECLYYILRTAVRNGKNEFMMNELRFDETSMNIHDECNLLSSIHGRKCCPFLDNPLNQSKCYATQSVVSDSTKQKAISDVVRSLEALGFIKETISGKYTLTNAGYDFVKAKYGTKEWQEIVSNAVMSYGVFVGFLSKFNLNSETDTSRLFVSYPNTDDPEELSSGSTADSNTRTVSKLVSWGLVGGFLEPSQEPNVNGSLAHVFYRGILNEHRMTYRKFVLTNFAISKLNSKLYIANPLSYSHLNKNVASLRERGMDELRNRTMLNNHKVLNRRFVLVYVLNELSKLGKTLNFDIFCKSLFEQYDLFFLENSIVREIMESEADILDLCGLPFSVVGDQWIPKTTISKDILIQGAPDQIIRSAERVLRDQI